MPMFPILLKLGSIEIRTYGVMLLLAFLFGIWWTGRELAKKGLQREKVWDLALWIMIAGVAGARLVYVWEHWAYFSKNMGEIIAVWHGGLTFYGGLLAVPAALVFFRINRWPFWQTADIIAPSLAAGIGIGRWGCFFNGCCYGKPTSLPWGISLPPGTEFGQLFPGQRIHPSPLYESLGEWILFFVLIFLVRKRAPYPGFTFLFFVFFSALIRFFNDFTRHYAETAYVLPPLTFNQLIAIALMLTALSFIIYFEIRKRRLSRAS
ncbi:MAG: prolipoprotein diacylglyceryl transferase [candidate division WOR-3 bacterium]